MNRAALEKQIRHLTGHLRNLEGQRAWANEQLAMIDAEMADASAKSQCFCGEINVLISRNEWNPITSR